MEELEKLTELIIAMDLKDKEQLVPIVDTVDEIIKSIINRFESKVN